MRRIVAITKFLLFFAVSNALYWSWFATSFLIPNKLYWRQLIFKLWSVAFVKISGMNVEVIGEPPRAPFFLVCNHLGYVDIPALRYVVDGVFVAKGEIRGWFLAGRMVNDMGNVFIDRSNHRDIPRASKEIIERLNDGEGVMIFPEGTSTKGEEVLPFNSSFLEFAARTDLPVHYCSISYKTAAGDMNPSVAICWWDETGLLEHMLRLFELPRFTAVITFGDEPIADTDRKRLARVLHEKVSEKFIPVI